jgi:hypothetical protein
VSDAGFAKKEKDGFGCDATLNHDLAVALGRGSGVLPVGDFRARTSLSAANTAGTCPVVAASGNRRRTFRSAFSFTGSFPPLWLDRASLRFFVHPPWSQGVNFGAPITFCACSTQKVPQTKKKVPHAISSRLGVIHTNVSDWFYK